MAVKSPPIKSPFVPLRHGDGDVDPDMLRQNFDRISAAMAALHAKLQVNYVQLPSVPGAAVSAFSQSYNDPTLSQWSDGTEHVASQFIFDGDDAPTGLLTIRFSALVASASGVATLALYVGGSFVNLSAAPGGGSPIGTATQPSAAFQKKTIAGTFLNSGGGLPIQLTLKGSGAGKASVKHISGRVHA